MIVISNFKREFIFHNLNLLKDQSNTNKHGKILVIDNQSKDCSDLNKYMKENGINGEAIINDGNWEWSAWWKAYSTYPNEEKYLFIHDSMFVTPKTEVIFDTVNNDGHVLIFDTRRAGWWSSKYDIKGCDLSRKVLNHIKYFKQDFHLVFGSMFCCTRGVLEKMKNDGLMNFVSTDRTEAEAAERLLGVYFKSKNIKTFLLKKHKTIVHSRYKNFEIGDRLFLKFRPTRSK
jgi:hypothetical protein